MDIKILVVDDSQTDMIIIKSILHDYNLLSAYDGVEAMAILDKDPEIDLMILDLNMPRMNGFEVLKEIQESPKLSKIVTLILTNYDELENEIRGLELGAVDYIRKPLNLESLRKRIQIHVNLKKARKDLEALNTSLEQQVQVRTQELVFTRDSTIHALIGLLEVRDIESGNHTKRTQFIIKALCESLRKNSKYTERLTDAYIKEIFDTSPLHDIGKVGIPDKILLKPGSLTPEEFGIMKLHVDFGINALEMEIGDGKMPMFIETALECIAGHHEKYDGSGYPKGLVGDSIPLPGRLMAIADVYDALISKRVYKEAFSHTFAIEHIQSQSGKHFDPDLVDSFVEIEAEIFEIANTYTQTHTE